MDIKTWTRPQTQTIRRETKENTHNIYAVSNEEICNRRGTQLNLIWHDETKGKQNWIYWTLHKDYQNKMGSMSPGTSG